MTGESTTDALGRALPDWTPDLLDRIAGCGDEPDAAIGLAREFGRRLPLPASGATADRWSVLAAVARIDLSVARVLEAHSDALAILAEAGLPADDRSWGVFAAESADTRLDAHSTPQGVTVHGVKPWCSLGSRLDAALVTAHVDGRRQLFAVDLHHSSVRPAPVTGWVSRGLRTVTSGPVAFDGTPATPAGEPGWYLQRPGFAWGGIGVAACWHGGARGLADSVERHARGRDGELAALHLGIVDAALHASGAVLREAATVVDSGATLDTAACALLAARTRAVVADAVERVLQQTGHALGPAPLAFDPVHAARVADLGVYVRQHHAERDLADLGAQLRDRPRP